MLHPALDVIAVAAVVTFLKPLTPSQQRHSVSTAFLASCCPQHIRHICINNFMSCDDEREKKSAVSSGHSVSHLVTVHLIWSQCISSGHSLSSPITAHSISSHQAISSGHNLHNLVTVYLMLHSLSHAASLSHLDMFYPVYS